MKYIKTFEFLDDQSPIETIKHELIREIEKDRRDYVAKTTGSNSLFELGNIIGQVINKTTMAASEKKEFLSGVRSSLLRI